MSERFAGKIALVTGAASGIGRETAMRLAAEAGTVCCADLNDAGTQRSVESIVAAGHHATAHHLNVTLESDWAAVCESITTLHGRLDILVNSAGISSASPLVETAYDEWKRVLSVNLDGAFLATRSAIRMMSRLGGSIVHLSSASGIKPASGASAYSTSKAALCMLARAAAKECRDRGVPVRVNTVCPGGVKTPLWTTMPFFQTLVEKLGSEEAAYAAIAKGVPGGAFSEAPDVVNAILFLASDESRFVTGTDLVVDGGYVL
jgi:NAD(P)-dependent dehydrogenase (short-subunit alcohol dehydrogenase family)